MKVIACYKCVPEEDDIKVKSNRELDFTGARWKVGTYDLNAVEAAMALSETTGASASVLTAFDSAATESKMKKAILARGPEQLYAVVDESLALADSLTVAKTLAAAVRKIGDVDVVLCGEGSGDRYSQQVGALLGYLLGWNTVNAVDSLRAEGDKLVADRAVERGVETVEVALPAVVSVTSSINKPRIAGMKDILAAGKKPSTEWGLSDVQAPGGECKVAFGNATAPEQRSRAMTIIEGDSDDAIVEFVAALKKSL